MSIAIRPEPDNGQFDDETYAAVRRGVANGEQWAMEAIDRRYRNQIRCIARDHGAEDPDGVANAVLTRTLQHLDRIESTHPGALTNWVRTTTQREVGRERRKRSVHKVPLSGEHSVATQPSFETDVVGTEWVTDVLEQLPSDQRAVVEMRVLDDMSIAETGARLGRSSASVRNLQYRAIRSLRVMLAAAVVGVIVLVGSWFLLRSEPVETDVISPGVPVVGTNTVESDAGLDEPTVPDVTVPDVTVPDTAVPDTGDSEVGVDVDGALDTVAELSEFVRSETSNLASAGAARVAPAAANIGDTNTGIDSVGEVDARQIAAALAAVPEATGGEQLTELGIGSSAVSASGVVADTTGETVSVTTTTTSSTGSASATALASASSEANGQTETEVSVSRSAGGETVSGSSSDSDSDSDSGSASTSDSAAQREAIEEARASAEAAQAAARAQADAAIAEAEAAQAAARAQADAAIAEAAAAQAEARAQADAAFAEFEAAQAEARAQADAARAAAEAAQAQALADAQAARDAFDVPSIDSFFDLEGTQPDQ